MKISFVMIVLNGMPFIKASLKSIYKEAYEIIIVEGAIEKALFAADNKGHSIDGTINFIKEYDDFDKKIKFISGIWPEKCEMQNKGLELVTGDYIWLIDSDEVYKKEDIDTIIEMLEKDTMITEVHFPTLNFWKGFDYTLYSKSLEGIFFRRIFKINRPCSFITHRPPTLLWKQCNKTTDKMKLLEISVLKEKEIYLYHYSYILEEQVKQKIELYKRYSWGEMWHIDLDDWYNNCFLRWSPENRNEIDAKYAIWTGDKSSVTRQFFGSHPKSVLEIIQCLK